MNKCRFIIGWMENFPQSDDLLQAANSENDAEGMSIFEYEAPEQYEWACGAAKAFMENWTAADSFSIVQILIDGEWVAI